jgi:hypothetical protein
VVATAYKSEPPFRTNGGCSPEGEYMVSVSTDIKPLSRDIDISHMPLPEMAPSSAKVPSLSSEEAFWFVFRTLYRATGFNHQQTSVQVCHWKFAAKRNRSKIHPLGGDS